MIASHLCRFLHSSFFGVEFFKTSKLKLYFLESGIALMPFGTSQFLLVLQSLPYIEARLFCTWKSVWSICFIHICAWESCVQNGFHDCSQSTKNAFLWPLWRNIWPILIANRKSFCVDLWRWMKHGISYYTQIDKIFTLKPFLLRDIVDYS